MEFELKTYQLTFHKDVPSLLSSQLGHPHLHKSLTSHNLEPRFKRRDEQRVKFWTTPTLSKYLAYLPTVKNLFRLRTHVLGLPTYLLVYLGYIPFYLSPQCTYQPTCLPKLLTFLPRPPTYDLLTCLPRLPTLLHWLWTCLPKLPTLLLRPPTELPT